MTSPRAEHDGAGSPIAGAGAVILHRIGPEDWAAHRALRLAMVASDPDAFWVPPDQQDWDEARWRRDATGPRLHLQARRDGEVLGGIGVLPEAYAPDVPIGPDESHLVSLWVRPSARGLGVSTLLMRGAASIAIELGRPHLTLHVDSRNSAARALYERLGFVRDPIEHPREGTNSSWVKYAVDAGELASS